MPANIPSFTSQKLKFWSFASMVMVLFAHAYNLNQRYLQPATTVDEPLTANTFIQYFLANGLFRFFIPMLFLISGYLYALQDDKPYKENIQKRVRTLLIPYLLWSAIGLLFTYLLELSPYGRGIVLETHLQEFQGRILLHDLHWNELLVCWLLLPVPFQLWFICVLFIYNLAYPVLRWCAVNGAHIFFPIAVLFWMTNLGAFEGMLFFSMGIWMQKKSFNVVTPGKWLKPAPWAIVFVTLAIVKTILAFKGVALMGGHIYPLLHFMHKAVVFSGLVAAWFGSDSMVRLFMGKRWFVWLSGFSFIIYMAHAPLISYATNMVFPLVRHIPDYRLLTYIFLPISILALCVLLGLLLRSFAPKAYAVLTGARG